MICHLSHWNKQGGSSPQRLAILAAEFWWWGASTTTTTTIRAHRKEESLKPSTTSMTMSATSEGIRFAAATWTAMAPPILKQKWWYESEQDGRANNLMATSNFPQENNSIFVLKSWCCCQRDLLSVNKYRKSDSGTSYPQETFINSPVTYQNYWRLLLSKQPTCYFANVSEMLFSTTKSLLSRTVVKEVFKRESSTSTVESPFQRKTGQFFKRPCLQNGPFERNLIVSERW